MLDRKTYFTNLTGFSWSAMRARITAGIMFILFILFILFAQVAITEQRTRMLQNIEAYGTEVTHFIAQISIAPLKSFSIYYLENYAFQFEQGELIAFCHIYDEKDNLLTAKDDNGGDSTKASGEKAMPHVRSFTAEITENGIYYGRVDVGLYVSSVYSDINKTSLYIIWAFCIAVVVIGGAVSLFIHRQLVKPILKLSKTTRTIAEGQFVTSDISLRNDEIGELASAINLMSGNLEESYRTLENKVDERTAELHFAKNMAEQSNHHLQVVGEEVQALLDNSPVGIVFVTDDYKVLRVNREIFRITGYESEDIVGQSTRMLYRDSLSFDEFISSSNQFDEDGLFNKKTELQKKDGSMISCAVRGRKTMLAGGGQGIVLNFEDITSRLLIEEELLKIKKLESVRVLARGIAHDFNNILGAIIGYTEMAKDDSDPGSTVSEDLGKVLAASNRAKDLVQRILAFSRQGDTERTMFQPVTIVKETLNMLRPTLPATIEIVQDLEDNSGNILADPTQVNQIVMNLCTNAYHVMEKSGGVLEITLRSVQLSKYDLLHEPSIEPGDFIQLSVKDTGAGIPQEIKEKIFDPYFTTKDSGRGTGLGLSIVHGIVKSYGGFISLYSEVNKGTVFHVFLPSVPLNNEIVRTVEESIKDGSEKILFVDDDEILTDMGKNMLTRLGYDVTVTNSSFEALEIFQNEPEKFDLVITDQTMPNMTGADLARRFLQIRADIPIILCTGFSTIISEKKAREIGVKEFLMKPISKKEISGLIRKVLDETKEVGA